ncbi:MAG TPA: serine/threonine-protein kinase [Kofleriaceae bacterium]|jgi:serine/threonine-protein kinase
MLQVLDAGFSPDERIGNYRVEHELGPTGSGLLLQARHQVLPRRAIIKVVHAAFAGVSPYVVQTLREACILEAISHPGVPVVYESGLLRDRRPWFAFEVINGPTLEDVLARRPLPAADVARLMRDLADVLQHAHRRGVIHRGLRPDRIVVTHHRRYPLCIPDWSEAIAHDASACVPPPDGSRSYVAPELAHADAGSAERVDDRADMFALGAIAYRALAGAPPFESGGEAAYVAVGDRCPEVPRELAAIIDSLLSFDRFDRPSASEVRSDVDWLLTTLPELQQHAAPAKAGNAFDAIPEAIDAGEAVETAPQRAPGRKAVMVDPPRLRRPRWTPSVHYVEATDVDIVIVDDEHHSH